MKVQKFYHLGVLVRFVFSVSKKIKRQEIAGCGDAHQEVGAGRSLSLRVPGLQNEFQDSQGYTSKPCTEKKK